MFIERCIRDADSVAENQLMFFNICERVIWVAINNKLTGYCGVVFT